jgi:hypothetical protein
MSFHCCSVISQLSAPAPDPSVGTDDVDLPEFVQAGRDGVLKLSEIAHVGHGLDRTTPRLLHAGDRLVEVPGRREAVPDGLDRIGTDVHSDDVRPLAGKRERMRAALAPASSGDQSDFSVQRSHLSIPL